jgi:hypothetical protein
MDSTFGTRLRVQREEQQIPLATIAEQTKIKLSLLEGLERDDLSRWPTGIFRRSYFRAYARAIGLEPDRMLNEFQAAYPDPDAAEDITSAMAQARQLNGHASRRPPTRLRCLIDSAVNAFPALHLQAGARNGSGVHRTPRPEAAPVPVATAIATEVTEEVTLPAFPPPISEESGLDLGAVAQLCTRLARALDVCDVTPVLEDAARVLGAVGLTLWVRDCPGRELTPVFAHGYSDEMTAQLGRVSRDSDNAIARAFRAAEARFVDGDDGATGAVVVPLLTPSGCAGVLALELRHRQEQRECIRAAATILAAQLSTLVNIPVLAEAVGA